jgi:TonB family protein
MLPVAAATDLATQLANGRAGATLIDSASVDEPIDAFAARLKQQFPDLVLVVAGGPEDQMRLSKLITDNVVYRFLHRPVSEQRIRLFLEAALRRHDSEHAEQSSGSATSAAPAAVAKAPANKLPIAWLAGGAALTILAIAGIWFASRSQSPPTPTATTTAPRDDAAGKITDLLVKADAAFARGALVAPRGDSAADHYRAALALAPGDARAQSGLEKVVGKLLSDAETALLAESIDTAESNVAAALGLDPSSTRAAFLAVQVRKERERGALARARENARATAGREQFQAFLRQANQRLRSGNLIEPAEDNARFYLEAARGLAPDDPAVARFSRSLQNAMLEQARAAAARGNASETELWIANADEAGASRTALADIRRSLQSTQVTAQAETMTRLTQAFARAAGAGQWIEPAGDNAKRYLLELRAADPTHPATTESRQRLGNELLREARIALGRSDLAAAERWLFHARDIEFTSAEVTATQRELDAARNRATGGATAATDARPRGVVAATTLERVQYSEPRFPAAAVTRGDSGWVDLEFTVRVDGSVTDVVATAAEPPGSFENSAISAVRRWRYRPVVVDGVAVEQRARLRIRFELQN